MISVLCECVPIVYRTLSTIIMELVWKLLLMKTSTFLLKIAGHCKIHAFALFYDHTFTHAQKWESIFRINRLLCYK